MDAVFDLDAPLAGDVHRRFDRERHAGRDHRVIAFLEVRGLGDVLFFLKVAGLPGPQRQANAYFPKTII